jgi:outer membrane immunogenic protein
MNIFKIVSVVCVALALGSSCAWAADMALKAPPPPPVVSTWTGFYVGVQGGGVFSHEVGTTLFSTVLSTAGSQTPGNVNGAVGGFDIGYNYQLNQSWLIGVQGDWSWTGANGSTSRASNIAGITLNGSTNNRWIATATGRVGYLMSDWLLYGKAGGAWMKANYGANAMAGPVFLEVGATSITRSGFTAGVGAERKFSRNITGKIEYDYLDFGTKQVLFTFPGIGSNGANVRTQMSELLAGITYLLQP